MKIIKFFKKWISYFKNKKKIKKQIQDINQNDPFIYK